MYASHAPAFQSCWRHPRCASLDSQDRAYPNDSTLALDASACRLCHEAARPANSSPCFCLHWFRGSARGKILSFSGPVLPSREPFKARVCSVPATKSLQVELCHERVWPLVGQSTPLYFSGYNANPSNQALTEADWLWSVTQYRFCAQNHWLWIDPFRASHIFGASFRLFPSVPSLSTSPEAIAPPTCLLLSLKGRFYHSKSPQYEPCPTHFATILECNAL